MWLFQIFFPRRQSLNCFWVQIKNKKGGGKKPWNVKAHHTLFSVSPERKCFEKDLVDPFLISGRKIRICISLTAFNGFSYFLTTECVDQSYCCPGRNKSSWNMLGSILATVWQKKIDNSQITVTCFLSKSAGEKKCKSWCRKVGLLLLLLLVPPLCLINGISDLFSF